MIILTEFFNEVYDKIVNIWKDLSGTNVKEDEYKKEYKDVNYYESIEENEASNYIDYYDWNNDEEK